MITKEMLLSINYYKKAVFTGSQKGMCYLIRKITEEEKNYLEAIWWEGPFNFEKTQKEKHSQKFFVGVVTSVKCSCSQSCVHTWSDFRSPSA